MKMVRNWNKKKTAEENKHIKNKIGMKTVVLICQDEQKTFSIFNWYKDAFVLKIRWE